LPSFPPPSQSATFFLFVFAFSKEGGNQLAEEFCIELCCVVFAPVQGPFHFQKILIWLQIGMGAEWTNDLVQMPCGGEAKFTAKSIEETANDVG
jgi:hypothetical protein